MKAQTKTAVAMFGGAATVVLAVGFGGVGISPLGGAASPTMHPSPSATQPLPNTAASGGGAGTHVATLTGCISGLDC